MSMTREELTHIDPPITEEERVLLDQRYRDHLRSPEKALSLEDFKAQLAARICEYSGRIKLSKLGRMP